MTDPKPAAEVAKDAAADKAPNPRRHYDSPEDLRVDRALDAEAKHALLTEWKQDLEQQIEAEAEGMSAADPISSEKEARLAAELRKVAAALDEVVRERDGAA